MRGVGDEAAEPPVGFLDPSEHRVEGEAQPSDLGSALGPLDAPREVAGRDRIGGLPDRSERSQAETDDPQA